MIYENIKNTSWNPQIALKTNLVVLHIFIIAGYIDCVYYIIIMPGFCDYNLGQTFLLLMFGWIFSSSCMH
jgi:hypothetical protein